jgi:serine protease AprX
VRTHPELVVGSGNSARLQLSGTSMAAAVMSGAAALMLDRAPGLTPFHVRALTQITASPMSPDRTIESGAGSLNVLASTSAPGGSFVIGGEPTRQRLGMYAGAELLQSAEFPGDTVEWGNTVVWGNDDSVIWGWEDSVIWGWDDSVIWGYSDSVIWGWDDSVIWGWDDSVIWGWDDSVIWGWHDSVIWGWDDSVIWGYSDSVIWGE